MFRYRGEVELPINSKTKEGSSVDLKVSQKVATTKKNIILFATSGFLLVRLRANLNKNYKTTNFDSKSRIRILDNNNQKFKKKTKKNCFAVTKAIKDAAI